MPEYTDFLNRQHQAQGAQTILMVLDQPFPPDARVEREAVALTEAGFQVHLLCAFSDKQDERRKTENETEVYRGITLHRIDPETFSYELPFLKVKTRVFYKGIIKNLNRTLFHVDSLWQGAMTQYVKQLKPDCLHIHDLRLVPTGLTVADDAQIPLVADLHENYPALMQILKGKDDPYLGEKAKEKWDKIEKNATWQADRVIVVIEEASDRLAAKGLNPSKITVIPNTVDVDKFLAVDSTEGEAIVRPTIRGKFVLSYVGFINNDHRGLHTVLDAMALLKDDCPDLFFIAAGGYRDHYKQKLDEKIAALGLDSSVMFTGWLDETEFVPYIKVADIGLCPHQANDHTHNTFPNKVYLYNLFNKPVITSDCKPLKRYVKSTNGGVSFQSENPEDLAKQIARLYKDTQLRRELGDAGHQAVITQHNWQASSQRLIDMYRQLLTITAPVTVD